MKTLYIDCGMGAAGDMLTAALLELVPDWEKSLARLNSMGIPGVVFSAEKAEKCGITGTHVTVMVNGEEEGEDTFGDHCHHHSHDHDHHHDDGHCHEHDHDDAGHHHTHRSRADVYGIIDGLNVTEHVKNDAKAVYDIIAEAESSVHGKEVTEIHFHEVGNLDAVADVTAVCMLMEELGADRIYASTVSVGSGSVKCAHGILPVPAPATALILKGIPITGGNVNGELTTPTGAALLKYFVTEFREMPGIIPEKTGYGMGKKDFPKANCVRIILGESGSGAAGAASQDSCGTGGSAAGGFVPNGKTIELKCNIDDMTAEEIGFAMERLFEAGAIDVFTIPIGMKKMRPGTMLAVLVPEDMRDAVLEALFRYTSTIGVRETICARYVMDRHFGAADTPYGQVKYKESEGFGGSKLKYEYEDLAKIARETGMTLSEVRELAEKGKQK